MIDFLVRRFMNALFEGGEGGEGGDGGDRPSVGHRSPSSRTAGTATVDDAPRAHTLAPPSGRPAFVGVDESELIAAATPELMIKAAGAFDGELAFNEGHDEERKAGWMQSAVRLLTRVGGSDAQRSAMGIGLGARSMPLAHGTPVEDLESPSGRMKTLNMLSQNRDPDDPNYDPTGDVACAGASIVGGVLFAEGRKGLATLLAATLEPGEEEPADVKALREKLEGAGEKLTVGDLQHLQSMVYRKLKEMEGVSDPQKLLDMVTSKDPTEKARAFVTCETIDRFMDAALGDGRDCGGQRTLRGMFQTSRLDIAAVDNDGDGLGNHVVLRIADEENQVVAYYDPWMKKGTGGQIINTHDGKKGTGDPDLDDYKRAGAEKWRGRYDEAR
jgi:hypothetical protein